MVTFILWIAVDGIKNHQMCDAIIIDAVTTLQDETIVIFRKNQFWLLNRGKQILVRLVE